MKSAAVSTVLLASSLVASLALQGSALAADYGVKGPEATSTTDLPRGSGGADGGKVVVPTGAGPYPLVVASHGFSASAANQVGWAEHFASYGFVVVAPTFPNAFAPDTAKNAAVIEGLIGYARSALPKADVTRVGLEGHSAGGLATTVAAAKLKPQAVVLFDPVDKDNAGKAAYATLCSPTLSLFAGAGGCNNQAAWKPFASTSPGPVVFADVVGATHCDGENGPRVACGPFCGGAAVPARQAVHARYATAFLLAHLKGDSAAAATLTDVALTADTALASPRVKAGIACPPGPTAGDAGVDGGGPSTPDAASPGGEPDAAAPGATPGAPSDPGAAGPSGGSSEASGCGAAGVGAGGGLAAFGLLGIGALAVGRRRRRHG
jgi:MYXO-CTERM domain-containing protein